MDKSAKSELFKETDIRVYEMRDYLIDEEEKFFHSIILNQDYLNYKQFFYIPQKKPELDLNIYLQLHVKLSDLFENNLKKIVHFKRFKFCTDCKKDLVEKKCSSCGGSGKAGKRSFLGKTFTCQTCNGKRKMNEKKNCLKCSNKRIITLQEKIEVELSNYSNKTYLSYPKYGHQSSSNQGDLFIQILYINDKDYELKEDCNIVQTVKVDFFKALIGFKLEVKTLNGVREITFAPGSKNKDTYKLSFEGLSNEEDETCGNFYVKLDVDTPVLRNREVISSVQNLAKFENLNEINRLNKI